MSQSVLHYCGTERIVSCHCWLEKSTRKYNIRLSIFSGHDSDVISTSFSLLKRWQPLSRQVLFQAQMGSTADRESRLSESIMHATKCRPALWKSGLSADIIFNFKWRECAWRKPVILIPSLTYCSTRRTGVKRRVDNTAVVLSTVFDMFG